MGIDRVSDAVESNLYSEVSLGGVLTDSLSHCLLPRWTTSRCLKESWHGLWSRSSTISVRCLVARAYARAVLKDCSNLLNNFWAIRLGLHLRRHLKVVNDVQRRPKPTLYIFGSPMFYTVNMKCRPHPGEPADQRKPEQPAPAGAGPQQQGLSADDRPWRQEPPQQLQVSGTGWLRVVHTGPSTFTEE